MNENIKISIIIPVYNREKYLNKTLNSILNQSYKNFEIIIINDGSSDNSLNIINNYKNKFLNYNIINIKNSGVSIARNIGIQYANGKYLSFIDSDDFIAPDFLEILYNNIVKTDSDISCCNYYSYFPKNNFCVKDILACSSGVYDSRKLLNYLIKDIRIHFFLCNKLWKKSLFIDSNIKLPDICFEDIITVTNLFYISKKIVVDSKALYYYTKHKNSLVNSMDIKKFDNYIFSFKLIRIFLEKNNDYKKYKLSYKIFGYKIMIISIKILFNIYKNKNKFKYILNYLKKINYYISDGFKSTENNII